MRRRTYLLNLALLSVLIVNGIEANRIETRNLAGLSEDANGLEKKSQDEQESPLVVINPRSRRSVAVVSADHIPGEKGEKGMAGDVDEPGVKGDIVTYSSDKAARLPILDIAVRDYGKAEQSFSVEIGPACFY